MVSRVKIKRDVQKPAPAEHAVEEDTRLRAVHLTQLSALLSKEERHFLRGCLLPASPLTPYLLQATFIEVPPHI